MAARSATPSAPTTTRAPCVPAADTSTRRRPDPPTAPSSRGRSEARGATHILDRMLSSAGYRHAPAAPRILLVDDDRDLLVPLAEELRRDGFEVITARDGEEALRRLDAAWPD